MHQPVLQLDTEEPSLVPQWLKDGVLKRNGCSTRGNRTGVQEPARRTPSIGSGWELQRAASDTHTGAADSAADEQSRHNTSRLSRANSLRGNSSSKLVNGSGWSSKPRNSERYNPFERASNNGHDRSSTTSQHDYWPASPDSLSAITSDNRSERHLSKDFAPRSALLYSPKQGDGSVKESVETPFEKRFPGLHIAPVTSSQSLSLETEFPALSPATANSNTGNNWGSALIETSVNGTATSTKRPGTKNGSFPAQNGVRMAEAIQNATANTSVANSEKSAREQLAMKQSKQLVPVIASSKHKGTTRLVADAKLTSALDPRKDPAPAPRTLERLGSIERPDGKKMNGMLALKPQNSLKLSTRPSNRTTFFESLRRTNSVGAEQLEQAPAVVVSKLVGQTQPPENAAQASPIVHDEKVDPSTAVSTGPKLVSASMTEVSEEPAAAVGAGGGVITSPGACNGHERNTNDEDEDAAKLTPEEEAFLRSLGWTDVCDDEDYALTEEEIAAFKASVGNKTLLPVRPKVSLLPLSPHSSLDQYISDTDSDSSSDYDMY